MTDNRVYNGTTSSSQAPTVSGLITAGGDTVTNVMQACTFKDVLGANGSTLVVTNSSVNDSNGGRDYAVSTSNAPGTITPEALTVTAASQTKAYDGTTGSTSLDPYSGLVLSTVTPSIASGTLYKSAGDSITMAEAFTSPNAVAAGSAVLIPAATIQDGNGGRDYALNFVNASGTINQRPLTGSRAYDGTTGASASILTMVNVVAGDHVTLSGAGVLTGNGLTNLNQTPGFAGIGTLAISGTSAPNYSLANITTPVALGPQLLNTVFISFRGVTLSGNLQGENFAGLNLSGVILSGQNLTGANMTGTNLSGANLNGANLKSVILVNANLSGATLTGANLMGDSLASANLAGSNLMGDDLDGANLTNADLAGANLSNEYLIDGVLVDADLAGANLKDANLTGADLAGANLTGANLHGVVQ